MRILQTDESIACAEVAGALRDGGHEVFTDCLPDPGDQHSCLGLRHGGQCPLDAGADLAIAGVDHPQQIASAGVVCSRRHSVPVVTVGRHDVQHPDLSTSLERMAEHGDDLVLWSVEQALQDVLELLGVADGTVQLHHDATCERIIARIPQPMTDAERARLAVRLLAAATATRRSSPRRDVLVQAG